jgi:hypothetical protein
LYAAAVSALLVFPVVSKADITYSGPLDEAVDNGGIVAFGPGINFLLGTYSYYHVSEGYYGLDYQEENFDYLAETGGSGLIVSTVPLSFGAYIGPTDSFTGYVSLNGEDIDYVTECTSYGVFGGCDGTTLEITNDTQFGTYLPVGPNYVGLEFTQSGQTYYGWAEIGASGYYDNSEAELYDYAFNNTPNDPILAGQIITPEPSTMSLFALGATALLLALMPRRKAVDKAS